MNENKLIFEKESYVIRGAIFEVYHEMGCGFLEAVYQECLEIELNLKNIPYISQQNLKLQYKNRELEQTYKPDLICFGKIIIELKAVKEISDKDRAQVHNYLKSTELHLGLLVNFGHYPKATIERIVR